MPRYKFPVTPDGLTLTAWVSLDLPTAAARASAGQANPSPQAVSAIIDTGTDRTCVSPSVLARLGMTLPIRVVRTRGVGGSANVGVFEIAPGLPSVGRQPLSVWFHRLAVITLPPNTADYDVLIGMDVIGESQLFIDGPAKTFALDF